MWEGTHSPATKMGNSNYLSMLTKFKILVSLYGSMPSMRILSLAVCLCVWIQCSRVDPMAEIWSSKEYTAYKDAVLTQKKLTTHEDKLPLTVASTAKSHKELIQQRAEMLNIREKITALKSGPNKVHVFDDHHAYSLEYTEKVNSIVKQSLLSESAKAVLLQGLFPKIMIPDSTVNKCFLALCEKYPFIKETPSFHQQILEQINQNHEDEISR